MWRIVAFLSLFLTAAMAGGSNQAQPLVVDCGSVLIDASNAGSSAALKLSRWGQQKRDQIDAAIANQTPLLFVRPIPFSQDYIEYATPIDIDFDDEPTVLFRRKSVRSTENLRLRFGDVRILAQGSVAIPDALKKWSEPTHRLSQVTREKRLGDCFAASKAGNWVRFVSSPLSYSAQSSFVAKVAGYEFYEQHPFALLTDIGGVPGTFEVVEWPVEDSEDIIEALPAAQTEFRSFYPYGNLIEKGTAEMFGLKRELDAIFGIKDWLSELSARQKKLVAEVVENPRIKISYGATKSTRGTYFIVGAQHFMEDPENDWLRLVSSDFTHHTYVSAQGFVAAARVAKKTDKPFQETRVLRSHAPNGEMPNTYASLLRQALLEGTHLSWMDVHNGNTFAVRPTLLIQDAADVWFLEMDGWYGRAQALQQWQAEGAGAEWEVDEETGAETEVFSGPGAIFKAITAANPHVTRPSIVTPRFSDRGFQNSGYRLDGSTLTYAPDWEVERLAKLKDAMAGERRLRITVQNPGAGEKGEAEVLQGRVIYLHRNFVIFAEDGKAGRPLPIYALAAIEPVTFPNP